MLSDIRKRALGTGALLLLLTGCSLDVKQRSLKLEVKDLQGNSVTLKNNTNGDTLTVTTSGNYEFPLKISDGDTYEVVISGASAAQDCLVKDGTARLTKKEGVVVLDCGFQVASVTPADGTTGVAVSSTIRVAFSGSYSVASATAQGTSGTCSGSIQVSKDDFATCIGGALSSFNARTAEFTPAANLEFSAASLLSTYKVKVSGVTSTGSLPMKEGTFISSGFSTVQSSYAILITDAGGSSVITNAVSIEGAANKTFDVKLSIVPVGTPNGMVTVTITPNGLTLDKTVLNFTNLNYNVAQTVAITSPTDDTTAGTNSTVTMNFNVTSTNDGNYTAKSANLTVDVLDNDIIRVNAASACTATCDGFAWNRAMTNMPSSTAANKQYWIATGTYNLGATVTLVSNSIVYGGFAGGETTSATRNPSTNIAALSGQNARRIFNCSGGQTAITVDGITIQNGTESAALGGGALMNNCTATFNNVIFSSNSASSGAGLTLQGGGTITVQNSQFNSNSATVNYGGGIWNDNSTLVVSDTIFNGNTAGFSGGGLVNYVNAVSKLTNVRFSNNTVTSGSGGAIYEVDTSGTTRSKLVVVNGLFYKNSGGNAAVEIQASDSWFYNCTFMNQIAGRTHIYYDNTSTVTIQNSILWKGTSFSDISTPSSGTLTISNTIMETCASIAACNGGTGNSTSNPVFVNDVLDNYEICKIGVGGCGSNSAAIDIGVSSIDIDPLTGGTQALPSTDLKKNPRQVGASVDLGAYEVQ